MRRWLLILAVVLGLAALAGAALGLSARRALLVSMVPIGLAPSSQGTNAFLVALTNHSTSTVECHVGRLVGNTSHYRRVRLAPRAGTVVELPPPKAVSPWTLDVVYQRIPGAVEFFLRRVGARLRLCSRQPAVERMERVVVAP